MNRSHKFILIVDFSGGTLGGIPGVLFSSCCTLAIKVARFLDVTTLYIRNLLYLCNLISNKGVQTWHDLSKKPPY